MNKEDYSKYYIQGSDHYLIPKDVFKELFNEMVNWKEEAKELKKQFEERPKEYVFIGNAQYKTRDFINQITKDNKELKEQLTTYQILHRDCKVDNLKNISKIEEMENQQKEFIEYMNKTIAELECDDVDDEEMKGYLIQRIDTFKEILQKYRSIIGDKE